MPRRAFNPPFFTASDGPGRRLTMLRDIVWDRPIFRPPSLPNPRVIFDPLPFRTQISTLARRLTGFAGRG